MIAPANALSTDVDGWVIVDGVRHPLWQIGPDRLMLQRAIAFSPRQAEVLLSIDGAENRMRVFLPEGSSAASPFIPYRKLEDASPEAG